MFGSFNTLVCRKTFYSCVMLLTDMLISTQCDSYVDLYKSHSRRIPQTSVNLISKTHQKQNITSSEAKCDERERSTSERSSLTNLLTKSQTQHQLD